MTWMTSSLSKLQDVIMQCGAINTHTHMHKRAYTGAYTLAYIHIDTHTHTQIYTYIFIYTYMCVYTHTYLYLWLYLYIHLHTHKLSTLPRCKKTAHWNVPRLLIEMCRDCSLKCAAKSVAMQRGRHQPISYINTYTCIYIYTCIHICIYVYIHMYMYTHHLNGFRV